MPDTMPFLASPPRSVREVSFHVTKADNVLIATVLKRAEALHLIKCKAAPKHWYSAQDLSMDLAATKAQGVPLDFAQLLAFDDFNFTHDIAGIARHLDRETGALTNCFVPRCARFPTRKGS